MCMCVYLCVCEFKCKRVQIISACVDPFTAVCGSRQDTPQTLHLKPALHYYFFILLYFRSFPNYSSNVRSFICNLQLISIITNYKHLNAQSLYVWQALVIISYLIYIKRLISNEYKDVTMEGMNTFCWGSRAVLAFSEDLMVWHWTLWLSLGSYVNRWLLQYK